MVAIDLESFDNVPRAEHYTGTGEKVLDGPSPYKVEDLTTAHDESVNRNRDPAKLNVQPCVR